MNKKTETAEKLAQILRGTELPMLRAFVTTRPPDIRRDLWLTGYAIYVMKQLLADHLAEIARLLASPPPPPEEEPELAVTPEPDDDR